MEIQRKVDVYDVSKKSEYNMYIQGSENRATPSHHPSERDFPLQSIHVGYPIYGNLHVYIIYIYVLCIYYIIYIHISLYSRWMHQLPDQAQTLRIL